MALKAVLASLEGLSEDIAKLYEKTSDGKYKLVVEDMVEKDKLDEFRNSNRQLKADLEKLKETLESFKGLDPEKYKELQSKMSSLEEKKLLDEGKIDEVIRLRTDAMKREFEQQVQAKDKIIQELDGKQKSAYKERDTYIVDAELRRAVDNPDFGFQSGVADLLKPQVLSEFTFKEGKVVRVNPDGTLKYGKNGDPATIQEFLSDVAKERPYLVKPSTGGGTPPNGGNGGGAGVKTIRRADFDKQSPADQMAFAKSGGKVVD